MGRSIGSYESAARRDKNEPVTFELDGEVFTAAASMPGGAFLDMTRIQTAGTTPEKLALLGSFMDSVLVAESRERFAAKLRNADDPLDLTTAIRIMRDLMAELTGNPTGPASPSQAGSLTPGESSTDGVSSTE